MELVINLPDDKWNKILLGVELQMQLRNHMHDGTGT